MPTIDDVVAFLDQLAPPRLAESWDNVGLLVGDRARPAHRLMTCLTLTPGTVAEAIQREADLVVAHHPLPFRPLSQVTTDTTVGRLLWELIGARIAVYSPHTAFDSATTGINQRLAASLGLAQIRPLVQPAGEPDPSLGAGRCGELGEPRALAGVADRVKSLLAILSVRVVGEDARPIGRVAVACGSGGSFLAAAREARCDCLVTGEASFHTCLEAEAIGVAMILAGHFASERFAVVHLAEDLQSRFEELEVWASQRERDPLHVL
jgi:dinuclear metal center YbgI/SA1388 family protein